MPCGELNGIPLNDEGEDLPVPLPQWKVSTLKSGDLDIKLYGMKISPPCAKLRYMLSFYKVPYTNVDGQGKPDSEYKKMPVLDIGDRQINDSYIVIKNLSPWLNGKSLTPKEEELERIITFELMTALEKGAINCCDLHKCGSLAGCPLSCVLTCCGCLLTKCFTGGPGADGKGGGPEPKPLLKEIGEYSDYFSAELGSRPFFNGDSPGITDVSLAGLLSPFVAAGASSVDEFLCTDTLASWHERMEEFDVDVFTDYPEGPLE